MEFSVSNEASLQVQGSRFIEEDGEFLRANLVFEQAVGRGQIWLELPVSAFSGGALDDVIDSLHSLVLGLADPIRDRQPKGRSIIRTGTREFGSGVGLGGLTAGYAQPIGSGWIGSLAIKLPTSDGDNLFDTGSIDLGVGVGKSFPLADRWSIDFHSGLVRQGDWKAFGSARDWVDHETVALTFQPNSKDAWILQFQSESSALRQFIRSSDAVHRKGTLAYRRSKPDGSTWTVFISEDYDPINNISPVQKNIGPDVVIGWYWTINSQSRKR